MKTTTLSSIQNLESGTEFFQSELGKRFTSSDFIDNNNIMECPASIISYSVMDNDWKVVVCMQKSQILQPVTLFMYIWLVLILSLILIIYFISKILARAISKPIEHFEKEIKHFNLEQLTPLKKMGIEEL